MNIIYNAQHYWKQQPHAKSSKPSPWASGWHLSPTGRRSTTEGREDDEWEPWWPRKRQQSIWAEILSSYYSSAVYLSTSPGLLICEMSIVVLFDKVVRIQPMAHCWLSWKCWTSLSNECDPRGTMVDVFNLLPWRSVFLEGSCPSLTLDSVLPESLTLPLWL